MKVVLRRLIKLGRVEFEDKYIYKEFFLIDYMDDIWIIYWWKVESLKFLEYIKILSVV